MTLEQWIAENRERIDAVIFSRVPNLDFVDDEERELWVINEEGLYEMFLAGGGREE